eukprot:168422-Prorocentrum_minimum.AAC.1
MVNTMFPKGVGGRRPRIVKAGVFSRVFRGVSKDSRSRNVFPGGAKRRKKYRTSNLDPGKSNGLGRRHNRDCAC